MKQFKIGEHVVGQAFKPLFLPDIGTFFNQDMSLAKSMVDQLMQAGVAIIKGEILHTADICLPDGGDEVYYGHKSDNMIHENYRALIERKVVSLTAYEELFRYCNDQGVAVVVSVYDNTGVDFAVSIGVAAIKVASSNITHQPLIEKIASTGLPMIFDTGHTSLEEAARAIDWARDKGAEKLIIEHSPLAPPNPVDKHNLRFMNTLGDAFGVPFGLSDHHASEEMLYAAIALGASILEKGVCPDDLGDEQDSAHALPIAQVSSVLEKINNIALAMGSGVRNLRRDREKYRSRMGLVAKHDLQAGDLIDLESVTFAFPAKGIATEHWNTVLGRPLIKKCSKGEPIAWDYV